MELSNGNQSNTPDFIVGKNELIRVSWDLLSASVQSFIIDEVNLKDTSKHSLHEVNIAEMLVLQSLFKETAASRVIAKISKTPYHGSMKSLVVMEVAKAKKNIYRVSLFTPESASAFLTFPLIPPENGPKLHRPALIKLPASKSQRNRALSSSSSKDDDESLTSKDTGGISSREVSKDSEEEGSPPIENSRGEYSSKQNKHSQSDDDEDDDEDEDSRSQNEETQIEPESPSGNNSDDGGKSKSAPAADVKTADGKIIYNPENHIAKTELCRLAYSLLSDDVKTMIYNEMNQKENNHPKHEVNLAEMLVLHSIFKVTRASRVITKVNVAVYPGHMKNYLVMEVARAKKLIHRVSQFTRESCIAYLLSPLLIDGVRPEVIKKAVPKRHTSTPSKRQREESMQYRQQLQEKDNSNTTMDSRSSHMMPPVFQSKTELCRFAYSLLSDDVRTMIYNEMNQNENNHPRHEVSLAEMLSLVSVFKETRASRIINKVNLTEYHGNMKSLIVLEVQKLKRVIPRLSQCTEDTCAAYLESPLVSDEPRPDVVKVVKSKRQRASYDMSPRSTSDYMMDDEGYTSSDCSVSFDDLDLFTTQPISGQLLFEKLAIMRELKRVRNCSTDED